MFYHGCSEQDNHRQGNIPTRSKSTVTQLPPSSLSGFSCMHASDYIEVMCLTNVRISMRSGKIQRKKCSFSLQSDETAVAS